MAIRPYQGVTPTIGSDVFVDELACVIGDVVLEDGASIWPFASLRGDLMRIHIGKRSNVQDNASLHTSHQSDFNAKGAPLTIGDDVTIGHGAVCHGCTIGNRVLVGMNAVVLDNAIVEDEVVIGAGALVAPGKRLESGYLYVGSPAKRVRPLTEQEKKFLQYSAEHYVRLGAKHKVS